MFGEIGDVLGREYALRRAMLLKRLDVTLQTFAWHDKLKDRPQVSLEFFLVLNMGDSVMGCVTRRY